MRLEGKHALITGAASGMGEAGALLFAQEGARVAALDRDADRLDAVVREIVSQGGEAAGFAVDVSDHDALAQAARDSEEWLGGLDVLWSHAGMPAPSDIETVSLQAYETAANVNLTSAAFLSGAVIKRMRARGTGGAIVFTSSAAGLVGSVTSPLYSAFKFGIVGLTKGLAVRYASDGIRVNCVCPGPIATPMFYQDFAANDPRFSAEENERRIVTGVPMGRTGLPIEVARAALWLASSEASFVTGTALPVDGGMTAR
jgi:NAD(P)-dependent dehydrogenase (short-subunit alcohol dehydrogenase family)